MAFPFSPVSPTPRPPTFSQPCLLQVMSTTEENNQYFSPDDTISLSLEYYQHHLDHPSRRRSSSASSPTKPPPKPDVTDSKDATEKDSELQNGDSVRSEETRIENGSCGEGETKSEDDVRKTERRYLQCPAAVTMSHLQKFLRMKHALSSEHKVSDRCRK